MHSLLTSTWLISPSQLPPTLASGNYTLEHMKMGPRDSYICLIPKPLDTIPSFTDDDLDTDVTPTRSWSLLQPLAGTCLYVCCLLPLESRSTYNLNSSSLHSTVKGGLLTLTATTMKSDNLKKSFPRMPVSQVRYHFSVISSRVPSLFILF